MKYQPFKMRDMCLSFAIPTQNLLTSLTLNDLHRPSQVKTSCPMSLQPTQPRADACLHASADGSSTILRNSCAILINY